MEVYNESPQIRHARFVRAIRSFCIWSWVGALVGFLISFGLLLLINLLQARIRKRIGHD